MMNVEHLKLVYPDGTCAVDDLSLTLADGESVALVGANGAGKTSLLLSLVGVLGLAGGSIRVDEVTLGKKTLDEIRRRVGLVFQNPDDQLFMPVIREDVAFGPRNFGHSPEETEKIVADTLETLGISHLGDKSPTKMSGGEKRMAAIATVLAMDPRVMLFDEPTAFLDPRARRKLIRLLNRLPHTKLIATHDLPFACEVCTRVVILQHGQIAAQGDPKTLLYDEALMDRCGMEAIGYMEE
ncbi:MAG: ABC transporter ATP-binding protein [Candidatus Faecousia sp.]|nr:ABC transporter ATP-binding protein [Bacillota bacterium]MDY4219043.1 ABC transporter ATP-binding protein [Candidatus Faecousia sp.]